MMFIIIINGATSLCVPGLLQKIQPSISTTLTSQIFIFKAFAYFTSSIPTKLWPTYVTKDNLSMHIKILAHLFIISLNHYCTVPFITQKEGFLVKKQFVIIPTKTKAAMRCERDLLIKLDGFAFLPLSDRLSVCLTVCQSIITSKLINFFGRSCSNLINQNRNFICLLLVKVENVSHAIEKLINQLEASSHNSNLLISNLRI